MIRFVSPKILVHSCLGRLELSCRAGGGEGMGAIEKTVEGCGGEGRCHVPAGRHLRPQQEACGPTQKQVTPSPRLREAQSSSFPDLRDPSRLLHSDLFQAVPSHTQTI